MKVSWRVGYAKPLGALRALTKTSGAPDGRPAGC